MSICCPHCNGTGIVGAVPDVEGLRRACRELGLVVAYDDSVDEQTAAALVHRRPVTLRNWRLGDQRLRFTRSGNRTRYALADIAAYLHRGKEIFE